MFEICYVIPHFIRGRQFFWHVTTIDFLGKSYVLDVCNMVVLYGYTVHMWTRGPENLLCKLAY